MVGSLLHKTRSHDNRHDPLKVGALDASARTYSTDAPPRCGIALPTTLRAAMTRLQLFLGHAGAPTAGVVQSSIFGVVAEQ